VTFAWLPGAEGTDPSVFDADILFCNLIIQWAQKGKLVCCLHSPFDTSNNSNIKNTFTVAWAALEPFISSAQCRASYSVVRVVLSHCGTVALKLTIAIAARLCLDTVHGMKE
jgi:hypothetical protein